MNNKMFADLEIDVNNMVGIGTMLRVLEVDFDDLVRFGR